MKLGVEPAKSTQSLYEQIRRDQFTEQNNNVLLMTPTYADRAELTDILFQLGQIQTTLAQTLHQVQREIALSRRWCISLPPMRRTPCCHLCTLSPSEKTAHVDAQINCCQ